MNVRETREALRAALPGFEVPDRDGLIVVLPTPRVDGRSPGDRARWRATWGVVVCSSDAPPGPAPRFRVVATAGWIETDADGNPYMGLVVAAPPPGRAAASRVYEDMPIHRGAYRDTDEFSALTPEHVARIAADVRGMLPA